MVVITTNSVMNLGYNVAEGLTGYIGLKLRRIRVENVETDILSICNTLLVIRY
jgi:hypothetical protein